nr:cytochrome C biogenesis FN [Ipomoea batatas]
MSVDGVKTLPDVEFQKPVEDYHACLMENWLALATLRSKQKIPKSHAFSSLWTGTLVDMGREQATKRVLRISVGMEGEEVANIYGGGGQGDDEVRGNSVVGRREQ